MSATPTSRCGGLDTYSSPRLPGTFAANNASSSSCGKQLLPSSPPWNISAPAPVVVVVVVCVTSADNNTSIVVEDASPHPPTTCSRLARRPRLTTPQPLLLLLSCCGQRVRRRRALLRSGTACSPLLLLRAAPRPPRQLRYGLLLPLSVVCRSGDGVRWTELRAVLALVLLHPCCLFSSSPLRGGGGEAHETTGYSGFRRDSLPHSRERACQFIEPGMEASGHWTQPKLERHS